MEGERVERKKVEERKIVDEWMLFDWYEIIWRDKICIYLFKNENNIVILRYCEWIETFGTREKKLERN